MLIGMTYDLRDEYIAQGFTAEEAGEFDSPETIDAIESALRSKGYEVERVGNIKALVNNLAAGKRWDIVFNICEGVRGIAREAQVPALLDAYEIPYVFSSPEVMVTTLDKALAKHIVRSHGLKTPDFRVVTNVRDIWNVALPYPLFVKPVGEGSSKGVTGRSVVHDSTALKTTCEYVLDAFHQPALVEAFLPGREFTVGILGNGQQATALGALEIRFKEDLACKGYGFDDKLNWEERTERLLADDSEARQASELALEAHRLLGCRDASRVDVRSDRHGVPHFIEINALSGLRPVYSLLTDLAAKSGISYQELIWRVVESAIARNALLATVQDNRRVRGDHF